VRLPLLVVVLAGCTPCGRDALRGSDGLCYELVDGDGPRDTDADADTDTDADPGFTRFVHLAFGAPPLDVKVAGFDSDVLEDLPPAAQTGFFVPLGPGEAFDLVVHDDGEILRELRVEIVPEQDATVWILPDAANDAPDAAQVYDVHDDVAGGRLRFRLLHVATNLPDRDFSATIDGLTLGPIGLNRFSAYAEVHQGALDVQLDAEGITWTCKATLSGGLFPDDLPATVDAAVAPAEEGVELLLYVHTFGSDPMVPLRAPCEPTDSGG
jgi:hypothetical protein